jgi:beta-lactamase regulating signal transducer with metallopeptidase domain
MNGLVLESLGWALVHLLWQGALVAVLLAFALRVLGRKAATARYALACTALLMMLVLPVATAWRHYGSAQGRGFEVSSSSSALGDGARWNPHPRPLPEGEGVYAVDAPDLLVDAAAVSWLELVSAYMPWLVLAWGLGVAFSSLRLLSAWMHLRRQVRQASAAPVEWQQRLNALSQRLGLRRAVRLLQSAAIDVPAAVGWLRPVVLLPASALTGLSARQLEMILAHELAHIRRYDFAVNLAQTLVETLLFYHPAAWWISRVIRVEREHCCDDIAAGTSGSSLSYARALTALEELRVLPSLAPSPAMSALGGSLPERVRRLVVSPTTRCSSRWVAGASVLTLVSSLAVAAPLTALVLPFEQLPAAVSGSSPGVSAVPAPSVVAQVPVPTPVVAPMRTPVIAPLVMPVPAPSHMLAAAPNPNPSPNPNPNPNPGRREAETDRSTRVGDGKLTVDQLVELKEAGVTPEMVETVKGMGYEPTVDTLVEFGHAGITPEYAKDMNTRFGQKLSADELAEMKHLGVTPEFIEKMKALGFTKAKPQELAEARAVGVDEAYLRALKDAGYTGMDLDTVVEMRAVGVKPETIAELSKAGYPKLDPRVLVEFRALGVTPDYIRGLKESGLKDLPADDLVELRALGVDTDFIREMRAAGLETLTADELVRLRSSGIDADFIRRMKQPKQ